MVYFSTKRRPASSLQSFTSKIKKSFQLKHASDSYYFFKNRIGTKMLLEAESLDGDTMRFNYVLAGVSWSGMSLILFFFVKTGEDGSKPVITTDDNLRNKIVAENMEQLRDWTLSRNWMVRDAETGEMAVWHRIIGGTQNLASPLDRSAASAKWLKPKKADRALWQKRAAEAEVDEVHWKRTVNELKKNMTSDSDEDQRESSEEESPVQAPNMAFVKRRSNTSMKNSYVDDEGVEISLGKKRKRSTHDNTASRKKKSRHVPEVKHKSSTSVTLHPHAYEPWGDLDETLRQQIHEKQQLFSNDLQNRLLLELKNRLAPLVLERQRLIEELDMEKKLYRKKFKSLLPEDREELKREMRMMRKKS